MAATKRVVAADDDAVRPVVAVRVSNMREGKVEMTYALLDSGSDTDVMSEELAERLSFERTWKSMTLVTVDNAEKMTRSFVGATMANMRQTSKVSSSVSY